MARKRKGSTNGKAYEVKKKERTMSTESDAQEEEEEEEGGGSTLTHLKPKDESSTVLAGLIGTENETSSGTQRDDDHSQEELRPLDIQQMILGDLQSAGQGEEIIVSRESGGDIVEDDREEVIDDTETVVESAREEEYEIHTEDDEDEELIIMNEDDEGEENQYVIVVNSDFEVNDENSQEMVSIHNLSDFQEGSCEIITVVRESDYDSSQESLDGMEEEDCDNINTVIGTIDGIHCVNISQYNSDDESSVNGESFEKELTVTEHETEIDCFSNIIHNTVQQIDPCESNDTEINEAGETSFADDEKIESNYSEIHNQNEFIDIQDKNEETEIKDELSSDDISCPVKSNKPASLENSHNTNISSNYILTKEITDETEIKMNSETYTEKVSGSIQKMDFNIKTNINNNEEMKNKAIEKEIASVTKFDTTKHVSNLILVSNSKNLGEVGFSKESMDVKKEKVKSVDLVSNEKKDEMNSITIDSKSLINLNENIDSSKVNSESQSCNVKTNVIASHIKLEDNLEKLQQQIVGSDSESLNKETSLKVKDSVTIQSIKNESSINYVLDNFCQQTHSEKSEDKLYCIKEETTVRDEEDKLSTFRSRSGSTDTTGSESGSNSSSGRRRSGRIRSVGAMKQNELDINYKSGTATAIAIATSTSTPPVPGYELDKPVKVKSRWRRSSELEMGSSYRRLSDVEVISANTKLTDTVHTSSTSARSGQPSTPPDTPPPDREVEDILATFYHLDCNEYLTDRSRSKDAKRMVCDCMLTKEDITRGDMGCGEDCLNRLLMIECGARCMLGERCANKRFQNLEYAKCEVFKTEVKGFGLRALESIPADTFLLEYVGEVLDPKEFRRRAKDYAKDKNLHFYFMALKSDSIIDATRKGNISRFINHSCDPNAETQKWTVNGELRVGFFSKRPISAGEEITFDYQLQRYGKEAQRCFCQTTLCRGWIGEDPEKENKWSDLSGRNKERREREKKKKEDKRNVKDVLNDIDLEEEIEKLVLKNRAQTLMLCRLMVRAEDHSSRVQLLRILQKGETACLRLFLDYHGLRLIWSWMMDPSSMSSLRIEILETLAKLPIPNKTMLQDSKVLSVVEKWSTTALKVAEAKDRSSTEDDSDKADNDKEKQIKSSDSEKNSDDSNSSKPLETEEQQEINKKKIIDIANILLKEWATLKEVFRIPKKERIEQMKEHEREADKVGKDVAVEKQEKTYDRHWNQDKCRNDYDRRDRDKERDRERDKDRKRGRDSPDSDKSRKSSKLDDKQAQMAKMERRQLFAIKAAQEEEERHRRQQENIWQEQVQIAALELAAQQAQQAQEANNFNNFPNFPPSQQWIPFPPPDQNMMPPQPMEAQPLFSPMNHGNPHPPFRFNQPAPHLHQHPPFLDPSHTPPFLNPVNPMFNHPPPLPKQPLLPTPPTQPLLPTPPLPSQPLLPTPTQPLLTTPPLPNQPYLPNQQIRPLLTNPPPLPNNPHPINLPPFPTQPPIPTQPPPIVITSQPPPIPPQSFPRDNPTKHFQTPPQNQFTQPPPFTSQPPLPSLPPTPSPQPVFQNPLPAQFQPPLPQTTVVPVTSTVSSVPMYVPTPVRLPPKWKSAKDSEGRTYYYHVKTRVSQWEPPVWEHQQQQVIQESESETDSSDSDEEDSSSEEEEPEEEKMEEEEEPEPIEEVVNDDDLGCEELGDSPYEPETMELLEDIVEDTRKKRNDNLVQERIISPRTAEEIPEKLDKRKIRELKEKLKRQKAKEKIRIKQKSKSKSRSGTSKCEADTSSDPGRKIKDAFRLNMAGVIVHYLNAYRKPDCKLGRITNTEDFKHLARKLTHFVMLKELKHCRSVEELECNDNVKHKARDFIKKYMAKFGSTYQRPSDDD